MKPLIALLGGLTFCLATPAMAQFAKPEDAVKYRQAVMTLQGRHLGAVGAAVRGTFNQQEAIANAEVLAVVARLAWTAYIPGSDVANSRTKPEALAQPERFKQLGDKLSADSTKLVAAARAGDQATVRSLVGELGQTCKVCHDAYRR